MKKKINKFKFKFKVFIRISPIQHSDTIIQFSFFRMNISWLIRCMRILKHIHISKEKKYKNEERKEKKEQKEKEEEK